MDDGTTKMLEQDTSKHIPLANNVSVSQFKSRGLKKNLRATQTDRNKLSFGNDEGEGSNEDEGIHHSIAQTRKDMKEMRKDSRKPRSRGFGFGGYQSSTIDAGHQTVSYDEFLDTSIKAQKRQYGTCHSGLSVHDLDDVIPIQNTEKSRNSVCGIKNENVDLPMYGKESLSKLIAEQTIYMVDHGNDQQIPDMQRGSNVIHEKNVGIQSVQQNDGILLNDDFIPLHSFSNKTRNLCITEPIILTGDEALDHDMEVEENSIAEDTTQRVIDEDIRHPTQFPSLVDHDMDEEGNQWEDTITRRAGLAKGKSITKKVALDQSEGMKDANERERIITNIRNTIVSTIALFQGKIIDFEQHTSRKNQEHDLSMNEHDKLQKEQNTISMKFQFYQNLRNELVTWVGATRDMTPKLVQIEDALRQMSEERSIERHIVRREWDEDVYTILIANADLDHVIGKDPLIPEITSNGTMTDEFGRDMGSLHKLARNKRRERRQKWRAQKNRHHSDTNSFILTSSIDRTQNEYEDSDFGLDDGDLLNTEERRKALSDAVDVVLSELDDQYISVSKLLTLVVQWIDSYPDDFDQCFASISFSEIIQILARFEVCSKIDLLSHVMDAKPYKYTDQNLTQYAWYQDLKKLNDKVTKDTTLTLLQTKCLESVQSYAINVIICKTCIPYLISALSPIQVADTIIPGLYEWLSYRQSSKMSSFYLSLYTSILGENRSLYMKSAWELLLRHLRLYIENQPTFLVTPQVLTNILQENSNERDKEKDEAIMYATFGQIYFWKKIVQNCCVCWVPILTRAESVEMAYIVLDEIVSKRLLSLLTVLDRGFSTKYQTYDVVEVVQDHIRCIVSDIYETISTAKWFDYDELMIASAPLRAIRHKYTYEV